MRIYIVGYMGSGKSSIGKKLAARLGYLFIDLDTRIEEQQNKTIVELFSEKGEEEFRTFERIALHETFYLDNLVVSTGGGTPIFFDNIDLMIKNGLCIYLQADIDVLISRLIPNQNIRPLIAHLSKEDLQKFIQEQLNIREPYYLKAQLYIEAKGLTPAILHKKVLNWIENKK